MKIEHLRTFLEVAGCGNFNQAAENLRVTQSTVSARIRTLEERYGRRLFERSHAGARLTSAGLRLRRYALRMEQLWQQSRQEIALPEGYTGVLALGMQVSLWERLILRWIPRMRALLPALALRIEADYSSSLMRQLSDGLLDIGVMYQPRHQPGLVVEDLLEETLVLVSTEARTVSAGWVEDYVFVDWGDSFRAAHGDAFPGLDSPAVSVGLGALGLQYVLEQGGAGYFPLRVVEPRLASGELHRVEGAPEVQRPAYVVYTATPRDSEVLERGLHELRRIAAAT